MRKKICVIDHYFHQNTKPFQFLIDILQKEYDVDIYWDYTPAGGRHISVDVINRYEIVFFFQVINPIEELRQIKAKILWLPMYDGTEFNDAYWYKMSFLPIRILCFCKRLYNYFSKFGFDCAYFKYYCNPSEFPRVRDFSSLRVFFWLRENIGFNIVMSILEQSKVDSFDLLLAPDPSYADFTPHTKIMRQYNINLHRGFLNRAQYISLLSRNNIFIAPRRQEGIGMSFLEALAMGHCVIAHNDATMSEYISDKRSGLLFNANAPSPLDIANFREIAKASLDVATTGYRNWRDSIGDVLSFVKQETKSPSRSRTFLDLKYITKYYPVGVYYKLRHLPDKLQQIIKI